MTPAEVLRAARKLIERPEAWTQGVHAKDQTGCEVLSAAKTAVCFCAAGAINRIVRECQATTDDLYGLYAITHNFLIGAMGDSVGGFNDSHTHAEVLAAFDRAIDAADARVAALGKSKETK